MRSVVFIFIAITGLTPLHAAELPKVLFFANPAASDNNVIRRVKPNELSIAERHFADMSHGLFDVTITQSGADINSANLARYQAVVFFTAVNPPGVDIDGLITWVKDGGGFVGIHSTANSFLNKPAFAEMLGANFDRRPWRSNQEPQTKVTVKVNDADHPATRHLTDSELFTDDIYQFKDFDPTKTRLLLSLDPTQLDLSNPKVNRADKLFPISWAKPFGGGRVFYTALGDWEPTWKDPRYRTHLTQGISWTMKQSGDK